MKDDSTLKEGSNLEGSKQSSKLESHIKTLEKELAKKESEIEFLKEKLSNNQEVLLDIIEDKKILKKQIEEFELKEIDEKLNNLRELQHKYHKVEHRLYITKKHLDTARQDLEERGNVIKDLEKRGLRDYVLGNYPESYVKYQKMNND